MSARNLSWALLCVLLTFTIHAQDLNKLELPKEKFFRPFGPGFKSSMAVCVAGGLADTFSTGDQYELNPLFRRSDGRLNKPLNITAGLGLCAATMIYERKYPKVVSIMRYVFGGIRFGVAIRNWRRL